MRKETLIAKEAGVRIDAYLAGALEDISRSYIKKLIDESQVNVNGNIVKANYKLKAEDEIEIIIPDPIKLDVLPEKIDLDIVYEDKDIVVVNKPKGMVVHPAAGNYTGTLVNALLAHCEGSLSDINGVIRPGIVHRIDKDTTGILVVAKNNAAHEGLTKKLKVHDIERVYTAICEGVIKEESGTIDAPIGRHTVDRKKMAVNTKNGRHAVTHFKVLERFKNATLIEARLETGRTHQIRVHMSYIGHPLLGDEVYGRKTQKYKLQGQALHATVLGFEHPITGEYMEFSSKLPDYFEQLIEKLRNQQ